MSEFGTIEWQRYDADDEATHPDTGKELIIIALKGGKPVYIPRGYFGLGIMLRLLLAVAACAFVVGALLALLEHLLGDSTLARLAQLGVVIAIAPVIGYAASKLLGKDL